jgi:hypothetical protein
MRYLSKREQHLYLEGLYEEWLGEGADEHVWWSIHDKIRKRRVKLGKEFRKKLRRLRI